MPTPTSPARACPRCGTSIATSSDACPRCLLELGLKPPPSAGPERASSSSSARFGTPPSLEDVRAAFPDLEIELLLGRGGMGSVFKARQPKLDRHVALKVLSRELGGDPAFAERFLREARALARLSHPGIVAVHDFGCVDGLFFLSMEYVDGLDLRRLMRRAPLEPRQALAITRELCDALQYAHDEGVVHRDIKPENVLLDARGRVKIADFGLAKLVDPAAEAFLTRSDQVMGTPHYMAPEQLERPREVDHRADLFALGVVLYEMLTGSLPRGSFEPPSHRVHVDVRLDEIVLKALAREPERRYQHALEVKSDVDLVDRAPTTEAVRERQPMRTAAAPAGLFQGPIRDWRPFAFFALLWIALASLWNAGPFVYGLALPITVGLCAWLVRQALRGEPELAASLEGTSRAQRAQRGVGVVVAVALGLVFVHVGQWALWELGTPHWHSFGASSNTWMERWFDDPWSLARLASAPADGEPAVRVETSRTLGPLDPTIFPALAWYALIAVGLGLLGFAVYAWLAPRAGGPTRKRAARVALELGFHAAAAWMLLWFAAAANFLRDTRLSGLASTVESPLGLEACAERLAAYAERAGLALDVDQRVRVEDRRDARVLARAVVLRAQADSPFERWSTNALGARRDTPQVWATMVQAEGSPRTTVLLNLGLYPPDSAESARASETLRALETELLR